MFTPVLAKHTKSFNLVDTLSVGVDRIQRNFEPMQRQVEFWRQTQISDAQAKLIFYSAFVEGKLDAPKGLLPEVHRNYFEPQYPEFSSRTMWSLSNAFTSAFKKLDPVPQFKATAELGEFFARCRFNSDRGATVAHLDVLPKRGIFSPRMSTKEREHLELFANPQLGDIVPRVFTPVLAKARHHTGLSFLTPLSR